MEMLQNHRVVLLGVTAASLVINGYSGGGVRRWPWFLVGALAAMLLAVMAVEMGWTDVVMATLAYGIMITYCPMMWLILFDKAEKSTGVENHRGHRYYRDRQ